MIITNVLSRKIVSWFMKIMRTKQPIIVWDATGVQNFETGIGRYSYQLIAHCLSIDTPYRFVILVDSRLRTNHPLFALSARYTHSDIRTIRASAIGPQRDIRFLFPFVRYDLFHCLNAILPLSRSKRCVVTVHDLIYLHYPQFLGKMYRYKLRYYQAIMRHIAARSSHIIAVSQSTLHDFRTHYAVNPHCDMTAVYPGVKKVAQPHHVTDLNIEPPFDKPYLLYIGEQRPHKNINRLIDAFIKFRKLDAFNGKYWLYLVGSTHSSYALPNPLPTQVRYCGKVTDTELERYYTHATALCFVSLYEGFGLPILEAMARGIPVITSRVSATEEIGANAALLVDPYDTDKIASAMHRIVHDSKYRKELVHKGYAHAQKFSWHTTATETIAIYDRLLHNGASN